jgi:hypothetical protein
MEGYRINQKAIETNVPMVTKVDQNLTLRGINYASIVRRTITLSMSVIN